MPQTDKAKAQLAEKRETRSPIPQRKTYQFVVEVETTHKHSSAIEKTFRTYVHGAINHFIVREGLQNHFTVKSVKNLNRMNLHK